MWRLILKLVVGWIFLPTLLAADSDMIITDFHDLLQPGEHTAFLIVDDFRRKIICVTPEGIASGERVPVVFFFHGAGGTARQAVMTYGWAEKARAEKFIAVFPEGLPSRPNEPGNFLLNPHVWRDERPTIQSRQVNDVHFFEVLLTQLEAALPIDVHRIDVTGFSNGAGMSFTLGGHFSDRIAAIAPVSSQSFSKVDALARPLPVYYLVGTADPLVRYHGGDSTTPWGLHRSLPPVQESVDHWIHLDGCPTEPHVLSDQNGVRVLRYGAPNANAEVLFTLIDGNGHHWPGTVEPLPRTISGPTLDPFRATDAIWDFFVRHPLK